MLGWNTRRLLCYRLHRPCLLRSRLCHHRCLSWLLPTYPRLHELPQEYEELLEYAALLHDIGYFYGYEAHHKHAYRMIMAADIPGLDEREKAIVANVARYHRSARALAS